MARKYLESTIMWFLIKPSICLVFLWGSGLAPSISLKFSGFFGFPTTASETFFTGWCYHHGCNTSLIFYLLHTAIILFVWFINIKTIREILILDTSLVCIVNAFSGCICFRNISIKILASFWRDYLSLLICHIICFAIKNDSKFLIVIKCSWNPAWWGFEVINPQALSKVQ